MSMPNLALRIISAAVLLPPILALIVWGPPLAFAGAMGLFAALSAFEYATIVFGGRFELLRVWTAALAVGVCGAVALFAELPWAPIAALVALMPLAFVTFMAYPAELKDGVNGAVHTVAGALYTGGLFGCIALTHGIERTGRYWVLLLLAAAVLSDTLAYTVGRLFGKRKLAPRISPGKTRAGGLGGLLGSTGAVALAKVTLLPELEWHHVILLGLPLGMALQIGDLAESFLKRGFGVKDSGVIIPGHGGILDRVDALLFSAPYVYLYASLRFGG